MPESVRLWMTRFDRVKSATTIPSVISSTSASVGNPACVSNSPTRSRQGGIQEVGGQEIDGDRGPMAVVPPLGTVGDRLLEDPGGQGVDEPALLRQSQQMLGRDEPERRDGANAGAPRP